MRSRRREYRPATGSRRTATVIVLRVAHCRRLERISAMRRIPPAIVALLMAACTPVVLVAPALAQTCVCPPEGEEGSSAGPPSPVIVADEPPPPLPDYDQPPIPAPGYHWTPGYWAWNNVDYYWVPGVWVEPPEPALLWTPGYWVFVRRRLRLPARLLGARRSASTAASTTASATTARGYEGGRWQGRHFFYNTAVNNIGATPGRRTSITPRSSSTTSRRSTA